MNRWIVIYEKDGIGWGKVFRNELDAILFDWELRMTGYASRIEDY